MCYIYRAYVLYIHTASNNRKGDGEAENVLGVRHVPYCSHGQDDVAQKAGVDHLSHHHATPRETSIWSCVGETGISPCVCVMNVYVRVHT